MFATGSKESIINVIMEYKGFTISLVFGNSSATRKEYLNKTEMMITKDGKNVTHLFFGLKDEADGRYDIFCDITLDTLVYVKAAIDCGKVR